MADDDYESMLLAAYVQATPASDDLPDIAELARLLPRSPVRPVRPVPPAASSLGASGALGPPGLPDLPGPPPLDGVLAAARAGRRPIPVLPTFAAPFAAAVGMFDTVLTGVDPARLDRPSPVLDWTLGDLVTHLTAEYAQLAAALGAPTDLPVAPAADPESVTRAVLDWTAAETGPADRRRRWWDSVELLAAALRERDRLGLVDVAGRRMSVAGHVVARAFETWIHARDIALGADLRLPDPAADVIGPMADLATRVLDGLAETVPSGSSGSSSPAGPAGTVALTLTGPGGLSALVRVGSPTPPGPPAAAVSVDVVAFCLLVADRLPRAELDVAVAGDTDVAEELLALAPMLSGP